jgi:uncharacterized protein (DUF433 family)/DNA-binding transcriptional MerR regulator
MTIGFGVGLYSSRVAARVAGIRYQNFQAWAKANLLVRHKFQFDSLEESIYSYKDLLLLRLIAKLKERGIKPKAIGVALDTVQMMANGDRDAWLRATICVTDGMVVVFLPERPEFNPIAASKGPQKMAVVFFPSLIEDLKRELIPIDRFPFVEIDPNVLGGAPIVKGTRLTTRAVASVSETGGDPKEAYPRLTDEEIRNAVEYEAFLN